MYTTPKKTWWEWHRQKSRHQSSGRFLKVKHLNGLVFSSLIHILYVPTVAFVVFAYRDEFILLISSITIAAILLINRWVFLVLAGRRLGEARFGWLLPIIDFVHPTLQLVWTLRGRFQKNW